MRSAFDTRAANFNPDQTSALLAAYRLALKKFPSDQRLPTNSKSKLAKIVVNLGRERMRQRRDLDINEISDRASEFLIQLRGLSLLS
jgi:predicted DNA-binding transcriptional regulator YafY